MADGQLVIDIRGDDSDFASKVRGLGSTAQSALSGGTAETGKFKAGLMTAATAAGSLAASLAVGVAGAVKGFASSVVDVGSGFEAAMSKVQALSGASAEEMEQLTATAKEMGSTTKYTATESADALGYMALAGWDARQSIDALPGVLNLAAASGMDLAHASDVVTDYLSAFGMEASQSAELADMLAYAQASSNTTTDQLAEAYKNCAAYLHGMGQDVGTVTTELAMMANQGLKGSEAGTALTAIMRDLNANMQDGAVQIGDTSVAVLDAHGNFRDLTDIVADVEAATSGMTEGQRAAALAEAFTADSTKGLNLLLNAGSEAAGEFADGLSGCSGAAADMAATMNDNLQGKVTLLQSAMDGLKLTLFEGLEPALTSLAGTAADKLVPALVAMAEGGETASAQLKEGFSSMLSDILTQLDTLAPRLAEMAVQLVSALVVALVQDLPLIIQCVVDFAAQLLATIGEEVPQVVLAVAQVVPQLVTTLVGALPTIMDAAVQMLTAIAQAVPTVVPQVVQALASAVPAFAEAVTAGLPQILTAGVALFVCLVQSMAQATPEIVSALMAAVPTMAQALASAAPQILAAGVQLFTAIVQAVPQVLPSIVGAIPQMISSIVSGVVSNIPQMISAGAQLISGLASGIANAIPSLIGSALSACGQLLGSVKSFFGIHSPSRVFAGIGELDMEGLGVGFEDEAPATARTAQRSVGDVMAACMREMADADLGDGVPARGVAQAAAVSSAARAAQSAYAPVQASSYSASDLAASNALLARIADAVEAGKTITFSAADAANALLDPIDAGLRRKAYAW